VLVQTPAASDAISCITPIGIGSIVKKNRKIKLETAAEEAKDQMEKAFHAKFDTHVFLMIGKEAAIAKYYAPTRAETCTFLWGRSEDGVGSWAVLPDIEARGPWMKVVEEAVDSVVEESLGEDAKRFDLG
jgi:hypothetical protein